MGQVVTALLLGIRPSRELENKLYVDDEYVYEDLPYKQHPKRVEDGRALGFVFACARVPEEDEGELEDTLALSEIESAFAEQIKVARKKWDTFAAYLRKTHAIELPEPEILLTAVECA